MAHHIQKASGVKEPFNKGKLIDSLIKAGADKHVARRVAEEVAIDKTRMKTTKDIHEKTLQLVKKHDSVLAAKYNLKKALLDLGPSGYPFEQFMAQLFRLMGYKAVTNQTLKGACITHETDIILDKERDHDLVECKFRRQAGTKIDIKIALYIKARFDDIRKNWERDPKLQGRSFHGWIATNAKFSGDVIQYAHCNGLRLIGWAYPHDGNIQQLVESFGVMPITCLTTLSQRDKQYLTKRGLVMCNQITEKVYLLKQAGITGGKLDAVLSDATALCIHSKHQH